MKYWLLSLLCLLPLAAAAQKLQPVPLLTPMVADSSQSAIQIHSSFTGTELLVFGARNMPGDLVIAMRGPEKDVRLRRKERVAGMWMNVDSQRYENIPIFYAISATRPIKHIAPRHLLEELGLGVPHVIRHGNLRAKPSFNRALAATLEQERRWQDGFGRISFFGESLFKARLEIPDNLPRGHYTIEAYLFQNGRLMNFQTIPLRAYKTGFDARIYDEAMQHAWRYGLLAIILALLGGLLAHRMFHKK